MLRTILLGFIAGCVAVVVFHQGSAFLLFAYGNEFPQVTALFGRVPRPFNMNPVPPLGVPTIVSQSFWGGVWGIVLTLILDKLRPPAILFSTIFGALALTAVAVTLVPYLKGLPTWNGAIPWRGLLYNGAWGFGVALMLLKPLRLRA